MIRDLSEGVTALGFTLILIAFVWSVILARRMDPSSFPNILYVWIIVFPVFAGRNWKNQPMVKICVFLLLLGCGLAFLGGYGLYLTNPYRGML